MVEACARIAERLGENRHVPDLVGIGALGVPVLTLNYAICCPQTSDSGQRNLLKLALENLSLAVSRLEGFLGKGIRNFNRL